jgi:acyl-CoA dehydrogenase
VPVIGALCNLIIFPMTKPYQRPSDHLGHRVASKILRPGATLDRLSEGIFVSKNKEDATGRITYALDLVLKTDDLQRRLRDAYKQGQLENRDRKAYGEAREKRMITDSEHDLLLQADAAIQDAIKVDEFSFSGWQIETP